MPPLFLGTKKEQRKRKKLREASGEGQSSEELVQKHGEAQSPGGRKTGDAAPQIPAREWVPAPSLLRCLALSTRGRKAARGGGL